MKREAEQDVAQLEEEVKQQPLATTDAQKAKETIYTASNDGTEAPKVKEYPPKTRIAMITGYNGSEFCGSQK
jgi:hypothetical protein